MQPGHDTSSLLFPASGSFSLATDHTRSQVYPFALGDYALVMGRCRYFKSVSVFRYTGRYFFFKSVRYSLSVYQSIAISVRYFQYFTLSQSATC